MLAFLTATAHSAHPFSSPWPSCSTHPVLHTLRTTFGRRPPVDRGRKERTGQAFLGIIQPTNAQRCRHFSSGGEQLGQDCDTRLCHHAPKTGIQFGANRVHRHDRPGSGGSFTLDHIETGQPTLDLQTGSGNHAITANMTLVGPTPISGTLPQTRLSRSVGQRQRRQGITKLQGGTLLPQRSQHLHGAHNRFSRAGTLGGSGKPRQFGHGCHRSNNHCRNFIVYPLADAQQRPNSERSKDLVTLFSTGTSSDLIVPSGARDDNWGSLELALGSGVTVSQPAGWWTAIRIPSLTRPISVGRQIHISKFTTAGFAASEWSVRYNSGAGNVTLNFNPVPEPGIVLGVAAVGLIVVWSIRRRLGRERVPLITL